MEINLNEEVKTLVQLKIVRFTKDYLEKLAMVEIMKCIVNSDTGEIIKKDYFQNRIFQNRIVQQLNSENGQVQNIEVKDFDLLLANIEELGEAACFEKLLNTIVNENSKP